MNGRVMQGPFVRLQRGGGIGTELPRFDSRPDVLCFRLFHWPQDRWGNSRLTIADRKWCQRGERRPFRRAFRAPEIGERDSSGDQALPDLGFGVGAEIAAVPAN